LQVRCQREVLANLARDDALGTIRRAESHRLWRRRSNRAHDVDTDEPVRLTNRSIFLCLASWLAASFAAADGQTLHNADATHAPSVRTRTPSPPNAPATRAAPSAPRSGRTSGFPESPYDTDGGSTTPLSASRTTGADRLVQPGRIELGVAFSAMIAADVRDVSATLSFGRFVAERFELRALGGVANLEAGAQTATQWSTTIEPAYHLPLAPATFAVLGMGVGVAHTGALGLGLAVAPRLGVRFHVGRWGVVTPALAFVYVTHRALDRSDELAVGALTGALRLQLGYALGW
jgi:hypothetical protein